MLSVVVPAEHPMMTYSKSKLLALLTNIRLSRKKNFPGTNTLAFFASASVTKKKRFIALTPGPNFIQLFGHNLQMFVISWSVCPRQAFPARSNLCR